MVRCMVDISDIFGICEMLSEMCMGIAELWVQFSRKWALQNVSQYVQQVWHG